MFFTEAFIYSLILWEQDGFVLNWHTLETNDISVVIQDFFTWDRITRWESGEKKGVKKSPDKRKKYFYKITFFFVSFFKPLECNKREGKMYAAGDFRSFKLLFQ